ncbi:ABC transporter permease [Gaiella sp.]|uniref:ABC transporter permease n=1 Tax=Gaiella sp. TaxID=2663207 RepID=UPI0032631E19
MSEAAAGIQPRERDIARRETLRQLAKSKTLIAGVLIVGFWVACALFGSTIAPDDPLELTDVVLAPPSGAHWFGTDALGRDVFSRVIVGASETLKIAPLATLLGIVLGTTIGLITGYFRGIVDESISRVIDAFLALPLIVLAVTALVGLGSSNTTLIIVIGVAFTPIVARTVRATVLGERELDYVDAAKLRGEGSGYIMFVEILPNITGPIIVEATVRLGYAIFAVAGLTFLGFGVQPPSPDWSLQIADNYQLLSSGTYWWTVLFAALAVSSLVVGVNLIADGLQQVLDR